jgi:hypothetical protein
MRKILGLTLALLLTLTLSAVAEEVKGTVKAIDQTDKSIVLDDGTKLTVSESQLTTLTPGDQVRAMYQTDGSKKVVSDLDFRGIGSDARGTTNWGPSFGMELDSIQAE